jgi:hypothetical protein
MSLRRWQLLDGCCWSSADDCLSSPGGRGVGALWCGGGSWMDAAGPRLTIGSVLLGEGRYGPFGAAATLGASMVGVSTGIVGQ